MEIWIYGNTEIWKQENMEIKKFSKYGNIEVRK